MNFGAKLLMRGLSGGVLGICACSAQFNVEVVFDKDYKGQIKGLPVKVTFVERADSSSRAVRTTVLDENGHFGFTFEELQTLPLRRQLEAFAMITVGNMPANGVDGIFPMMGNPGERHRVGILQGDSTKDGQIDEKDFAMLYDALGSAGPRPTIPEPEPTVNWAEQFVEPFRVLHEKVASHIPELVFLQKAQAAVSKNTPPVVKFFDRLRSGAFAEPMSVQEWADIMMRGTPVDENR